MGRSMQRRQQMRGSETGKRGVWVGTRRKPVANLADENAVKATA